MHSMDVKEIINWYKLSELLTGSKYKLRKDFVNKGNKEIVAQLIEAIETVLEDKLKKDK